MSSRTVKSHPAFATAIIYLTAFGWQSAVVAQSIVPGGDTDTQVTRDGNNFQIQGGAISGDGGNLFHTFEQFNVPTGQTANFLSTPQIQNILTQVIGGNASIINGTLQITGSNANLFLLNPAGIVFGPNASLNVPAAFTATTANGVGFNGGFFAGTSNDYQTLVGSPNTFAFAPDSGGSILNAGNLAVGVGQSLSLIGGTMINTGTLSAPGGQITIASIPGENLVRINQSGMLLGLDVLPPDSLPPDLAEANINSLTLPELLTGGNVADATNVTVNSDGTVSLSSSPVRIPTETGTTIVTGQVSAATVTEVGGNVTVVGEKVGAVAAEIDASGTTGGNVFIGGDDRGNGSLPTASRTLVSNDTIVRADASSGNGGRVIIWADDLTGFYGQVSARGLRQGGNGGFVEVSGKQNLIFDGRVDVTATNGRPGTLLLDPTNITISNDPDDPPSVGGQLPDILSDDFAADDITINFATLQSQAGDIILEATNNITIADGISLTFNSADSIIFTADADNDGTGAFSMDPTQSIAASGTNVTISAATMTLGNIDTSANGQNAGGAITLRSSDGDINIEGTLNSSSGTGGAGTIAVSTDGGNITLGADVMADQVDVNSSAVGQGTGGNITLEVRSGDGIIDTRNATLNSSSNSGGGGNITLSTTGGDILTGDLDSTATGQGTPGQISLGVSGGDGNIDTSAGTLDSSATAGDASPILLTTNGGNITTGDLDAASSGGAAGDINIDAASGLANVTGTTSSNDLTVRGSQIDFTGGANTVEGTGVLRLQPDSNDRDIAIALSDPGDDALDLSSTDLAALAAGFQEINIGGTDGDRTVTLGDSATFDDPVRIQGGSTLVGPNRETTWTIDGENSGTLDGYPNGLRFDQIENVTGGSEADTFNFDDDGRLTGTLDGGNGEDTVNADDDETIAATINNVENFSDPSSDTDNGDDTDTDNGDDTDTDNGDDTDTDNDDDTDTDNGDDTDTDNGDVGNVGEPGTPSGAPPIQPTPPLDLQFVLDRDSDETNNDADNSVRSERFSVSDNIGNAGEPGTPSGAPPIQPTPPLDLQFVLDRESDDPDNSVRSERFSVSDDVVDNPDDTDNSVRSERFSVSDNIGNAGEPGTPSGAPPIQPTPPLDLQFVLDRDSGETSEPTNVAEPTPEIIPTPETAIAPTPEPVSVPGSSEPISTATSTPATETIATTTTSTPAPDNPPSNQLNQSSPTTAENPGDVLQINPIYPFTHDRGRHGGTAPTVDSSLNLTVQERERLRLGDLQELRQLLDRGEIERAVEMGDRLFSEEFLDYLRPDIKRPYLSFASMRSSLQQMAKETGTNAAIVYVFMRDDQLDLILVPTEGKPIYKSVPAAGSETLLAKVEQFHTQITDPIFRQTNTYLSSAKQLYDWIVAPLADDLENLDTDTLIFSLDAGLRTLPLAALNDGEQFLIEKYSLTVTPSLHLLDPRYRNLQNSPVLAMGISEFPDKNPLPAVPVELQAIAQNTISAEILFDSDATLDNLQKFRAQTNPGIIHIATHAQFKSGQLNNSYIQLSDRQLHLDRIPELNWNNPAVDLLVLSACRTAIGDREAEYGFAGLAVQAGVKSAVASLWYANDAATLGLMSEFYAHLRSSPIKAEGLRQAQIAMLQGELSLKDGSLVGTFGQLELPQALISLGDRTLTHPYYWSGFTMIGSPW